MPRFTIVRTDHSARTELTAGNADAVLHAINRLRYHDADVFRDGVYAFSVQVGDGGFWTIYHSDAAVEEYELLG